jgi:hypothetical protein
MSALNRSQILMQVLSAALLTSCVQPGSPGAQLPPEKTVTFRGVPRDERVSLEFSSSCRGAFSVKGTKVRQEHPLPDGTRCEISVTVRDGFAPVSGMPLFLAIKGCSYTSPFTRVDRAVTRDGVGRLTFNSFEGKRNCAYLVTAGPERHSRSQRIVIPAYVEK